MVSKIKVDEIESSQSGGSVDLNSSLSFDSKTTTEMNALTGMSAGDTIYNSTDGTLYVYNGSSWNGMSSNTHEVTVSYLVIAGGGAGGGYSAGGAGGYRSSYSTDVSGANSSTESTQSFTPDGSTTYTVTVGGGGSSGSNGSTSTFNNISSVGGGHGETPGTGNSGGSGAGGGSSWTSSYNGGAGTANQGMAGGRANAVYNHDLGGGGGGASAAGTNSS